MLEVVKFFFARSTEKGSRTLVAAACAGDGSHGIYMSNGRVDCGALSDFVKSEDGARVGGEVWRELRRILEGVDEGVTGNLEG